MDLLDFLWNVNQERQIGELRGQLRQVRLEYDLAAWDLEKVKDLAEENLELKLRLGLLVRLLVKKGLITAQEFAALLAEARSTSSTAITALDRSRPSSQ